MGVMVVGNARSSTEGTVEDMVGVVLGGTVSSEGGVWFVVVWQVGWEGTRFSFVLLGGMVSPVGFGVIVVCGGGWEGRRVAFELACSTDDQGRVMKQEQANLWAASVLACIYLV